MILNLGSTIGLCQTNLDIDIIRFLDEHVSGEAYSRVKSETFYSLSAPLIHSELYNSLWKAARGDP